MASRPKVFCVGFHKTGTTSLFAALTELGYRVSGTVGHHLPAPRLAKEGGQLCIDTARKFDAVEDMPWPLFFRDLDKAFPGSKFVLTVREPESWFASIDRHFGEVDTAMHQFVYGAGSGRAREAKDRWIAVVTAHNEAVRAHFSARPGDLLEMDLASGDGWEKLAAFLGAEAPATAFPVKNRSSDRESFAYRFKKKLNELFGRTPHPERLV